MGILGKVIFGFAGVGVAIWGVNELRLAGAASETPTRMTCKELGEKGAAGNPHVLLTDFLLTGDIVYQHQKKSSDKSKWTKVWVPAVPTDGPYAKALVAAGGDLTKVPSPRPVQVIVVDENTHNEEELAALGDKKELDGMVVNMVSSISGKEKELLEQSYGDVSRAQIFEVGRRPAKTLYAVLAIAGGAIVLLLVLRSFFRKRQQAAPAPA